MEITNFSADIAIFGGGRISTRFVAKILCNLRYKCKTMV